MTLMSETPAREANSSFVHPLRARSSAISCALNCTGDAALDVIGIQTLATLDSTVNNKIQQWSTMESRRVLGSPPVPRRPVYDKELGRFFAELRATKGWTQRQAAEIAARKKGAEAVTRQVLLRLEAGRTKNPEPEVLRGLGVLYDLPYRQLAGRFIARRYEIDVEGRDLPRHAPEETSSPHEGGSDVPASESAQARILELEARLEEREAFIRQVQDAAIATVRLFGADAIAAERRSSRTAQRRGRRADRKAG